MTLINCRESGQGKCRGGRSAARTRRHALTCMFYMLIILTNELTNKISVFFGFRSYPGIFAVWLATISKYFLMLLNYYSFISEIMFYSNSLRTARYASEGITAACDWAYKNVTEDSTLSGISRARHIIYSLLLESMQFIIRISMNG
jgi:hypothetical protein